VASPFVLPAPIVSPIESKANHAHGGCHFALQNDEESIHDDAEGRNSRTMKGFGSQIISLACVESAGLASSDPGDACRVESSTPWFLHSEGFLHTVRQGVEVWGGPDFPRHRAGRPEPARSGSHACRSSDKRRSKYVIVGTSPSFNGTAGCQPSFSRASDMSG